MHTQRILGIRTLAAVLLGSALLAGCGGVARQDGDIDTSEDALSGSKCPDGVPATLAPAADQRLSFVLHAEGVQIYACSATATGYGWVFKAPQAVLMDAGGEVVGSHYAGPTWQFEDASTVVGAKLAGATVDPTSIPWLLLGAVSHAGEGKMTQVTSIQRLSTGGGNAPAGGCDASAVGTLANVPYTADYFFYKTGNGNPDNNPSCGG